MLPNLRSAFFIPPMEPVMSLSSEEIELKAYKSAVAVLKKDTLYATLWDVFLVGIIIGCLACILTLDGKVTIYEHHICNLPVEYQLDGACPKSPE